MRMIKKIADGAYFAPSYFEQTVISFQPGVTTQSVITESDEEDIYTNLPEIDDNNQPLIISDPLEKPGIKKKASFL